MIMEIRIAFKDSINEEPGKPGGQRFKEKAREGQKGRTIEICEGRKGEEGGMEERGKERDAGRYVVPRSLQTSGESVTDLRRSSGKCLILGRQA